MTYIPKAKRWSDIKSKLETEGAKNKQYDSDLDAIIDLAAIPTITKDKLEYPTENVNIWYLAFIDKAESRGYRCNTPLYGLFTKDAFVDKALDAYMTGACCCDNDARAEFCDDRFSTACQRYSQYANVTKSTMDHLVEKCASGGTTTLGSESVDLEQRYYYRFVFSVEGSSLNAYRDDLTTPKITVTDSELSSGRWGHFPGVFAKTDGLCNVAIFNGILKAPLSKAPKAIAVLEVDITQVVGRFECLETMPLLAEEMKPATVSKNPYLFREYKKYELLKNKGFSDEEIPIILGYMPQYEINVASVTWGAFDFRPEHNTMLITVSGGNQYTGEKAILKQIEFTKSKNLKVLKPPKDYNEAVEQYKQLKREFDFVAGKDNYAYQTLGHEVFGLFQVADTYYGNVVDEIKPDAYKNVPSFEMERTLNMWMERLKRATILKEEAEKHLKKLEEVEKKGW